MLEELVASCNGRPIPIRTFSYNYEELSQSTDNYDDHRVLLREELYNYYEGYLQGRTILVKYPEITYRWELMIFTDLAISAKMSHHKNILKLTGCCLETRFPTLVFESVKKGTLSDRIHALNYDGSPRQRQSTAWGGRLQVSRNIAHAIHAYIHTAFSRPIIHWDIKSSNILFDQDDVPKLSNFSLSISIPEGETHAEDVVWGTDESICRPSYRATSLISEKTDVYSFGVLLLVLLTGQPAFNPCRGTDEEDKDFLVFYVRKRGITEIVDPGILRGERGGMQNQWEAVILHLALICVDKDPEKRPTMVDVTKELRRIESFVAGLFC